ncbi:HAMP domain-containing sensor histidine kinase [Lactobacillus sp. ESL0701]|uniref:sensor histidine kinase n=1 Tax=Lactobacillus sp. ESL0701 TaxID=2983217 RepID=UPI0023F8DA7F|nr:HAMP domain-containing sensor histidine kinase [Lactobacillus sp. ESL0701]MDF7672338.1 HAMP domain-containing sensor histidine kinase [Lactobacillus sp. ESL0701]
MARRRSISYLLIEFLLVNGIMIIFLTCIWFFSDQYLATNGVIYPANYDEQKVQQFVKRQSHERVFNADEVPDNVSYALFNQQHHILKTNTTQTDQQKMRQYLHYPDQTAYGYQLVRYPNKSVVVLHYYYLIRYVNSVLQKNLPPYEYFSLGILLFLILFCLVVTTVLLRNKIVKSVNLFHQVGEKIAKRNLDFKIPQSNIKEFEHALNAMAKMQSALKESLISKWAQEQSQQQEVSALSHDLKTPLTIIHGNSELLLEDNNLTQQQRENLQSIMRNTIQADEYLDSLRAATNGDVEQAENIDLNILQSIIIQRAQELVYPKKIKLIQSGIMSGYAYLQKSHIIRAIINVIENAVTFTSTGEEIKLSFKNRTGQVQIGIYDQGPGFSKSALLNATKRFWKEDQARKINGHSGLGLWFANDVVSKNKGQLIIKNGSSGGIVLINLVKIDNKHEN